MDAFHWETEYGDYGDYDDYDRYYRSYYDYEEEEEEGSKEIEEMLAKQAACTKELGEYCDGNEECCEYRNGGGNYEALVCRTYAGGWRSNNRCRRVCLAIGEKCANHEDCCSKKCETHIGRNSSVIYVAINYDFKDLPDFT